MSTIKPKQPSAATFGEADSKDMRTKLMGEGQRAAYDKLRQEGYTELAAALIAKYELAESSLFNKMLLLGSVQLCITELAKKPHNRLPEQREDQLLLLYTPEQLELPEYLVIDVACYAYSNDTMNAFNTIMQPINSSLLGYDAIYDILKEVCDWTYRPVR